MLVDNVKVHNLLDVPNCDGIDPDHSRNVEIRNCNITCGDDGVVIKCSRQPIDYGEAANIHVHDCVIETQDAGLKIGTETTSDIHDIRFERCHIKTSSRGLCIQLRDEGNIHDILFRDITFTSRFYGDPWWGRGEAISFTAIPRTATTKVGSLHNITVQNVTGHAENSVRVCGSEISRECTTSPSTESLSPSPAPQNFPAASLTIAPRSRPTASNLTTHPASPSNTPTKSPCATARLSGVPTHPTPSPTPSRPLTPPASRSKHSPAAAHASLGKAVSIA